MISCDIKEAVDEKGGTKGEGDIKIDAIKMDVSTME
jgi:hypothetical protein